MALRDWYPLQKSLEVAATEGWRVLPKPTETNLDTFEQQSEFRLPASYREFMRVFGPGFLAGTFLIFGPECQNRSFDLGLYNKNWIKSWKRNSTLSEQFYEDPEQARRIVIFCRTENNDLFCWDPIEVRNARRHEYAVFSLPRLASRPTPVAVSFKEFVEKVCLGPWYYTKYLERSSRGKKLMPATFYPAAVKQIRSGSKRQKG